MTDTIGAFFDTAVRAHGARAFIAVPADEERPYHPAGLEWSYAEAAAQVGTLRAALEGAGYGHGDRIAVLLGNRPEMVLFKLACNILGISWVPVNPDYRPAETAYLLEDSGAGLTVAAPEFIEQMRAGIAESGRDVPLCELDTATAFAPTPKGAARTVNGLVTPETEASLIYTSGTTGRPKGCILSHAYEISLGEWYASRGGLIRLEPGHTRIYCPLPLFHVNAGIFLTFAVMATGSCQIVPERFRASAWWREIVESRATAAHYLGIIIPALMKRDPDEWERRHTLEWALGAGVEPTLHRPFEDRFGLPLIEVWGMTEMCRILTDNEEPRRIDTRAMGRPQPGLEVRVVDDNDHEVPRGTPGEMVLRHSAQTPRKGAFSGYLNLPEATEEAWRGGWFHTGDTVEMDETDMITFVDRKKNIIRRSGENIAAAEIEACLLDHPSVRSVAVLAVPDPLRDEEVMACVVCDRAGDAALAEALFAWCFERLAYYKAPGWVQFRDMIPVTGTQKIQKHALFAPGSDPTTLPRTHDFRALKRRETKAG
ncbi:crotonobetaine/carnitine-CoA ligase [Salinihabitans flavidus]|uniref:Crotonobetaine/carnitine-CoA ligase n=1 Tax=Salinihabitans flavidus TaxID=569882 RepID=A0A1H8VB36_9RHOB|nr:AMP-binding protein [Salinihabitans flavidus]SEP12682.1 crotonobetaine/carnitine-CoA ligase [Salinihabitans flavidus]